MKPRTATTRLTSVVAADPTGVVMNRVASAMRVLEDLSACQLAPAAAKEAVSVISQAPPAPTWLFTLRGGCGCRGVSSDLRCPKSVRSGSHIRKRGGRRHASPRRRALQRERLSAAILCGFARRRDRRAGDALRFEFVTAPGRGLPVHGPGSGSTGAQRGAGSGQRPYASRRRPPDLRGACDRDDFDGTAAWTRSSRASPYP